MMSHSCHWDNFVEFFACSTVSSMCVASGVEMETRTSL